MGSSGDSRGMGGKRVEKGVRSRKMVGVESGCRG